MRYFLLLTIGLVVATPDLARVDAGAEEHHRERTIVVSGEGEARGRPDMAEIHVGVVTEADSAKKAVQANNEAMSSLFATLRELGIGEKEMQTSNFSVSPQHRRDPEQREQPPRIVAYRVSNQVHVRIRDLESIGPALDKIVQSGANQIHGIRFSVEDAQALADKARREAVRDARRKARLLADEAKVRLGRVMQIRESSSPGPRPQRQFAVAEARSSVPIASGEQTITARVEMTFELAGD